MIHSLMVRFLAKGFREGVFVDSLDYFLQFFFLIEE